MLEPSNLGRGQIAIDPRNGVLFYKDGSGNLTKTTLSWAQNTYTTISTNDDVTISNNLIIQGNLTVNGTTVTINTETVSVEDNILILNSNVTGEPTLNSGIEVERGTSSNVSILWNESADKWQFTNDGVNFYDINSIVENSIQLGYHTTGDYIKNLVAGTGISLANNSGEGATPTVTLTATIDDLTDVAISSPAPGDFLRYSGSNWINDPVNLATDTIGDYVQSLVAGTGVAITNNSGEGTTPTIAIGQDVSTGATPTFGRIIAPVTGDVTGNVMGNLVGNVTGNVTGNVSGTVSDISNHGINDLSDVALSSPSNGDFLRYNGANWINDPVNLSTDTVGDYVSIISAGSGITVTSSGGEGSTPHISLNATLDDLLNVNLAAATPGQIMIYLDGQWVNSTLPTNEPMGHQNKNDSVISFNNSTREFSIAPSSSAHYVWCKGKRFTKTTTETTTIGSSSGLYYIYYDSEGMLQNKTTYFDFENETPVSYIYWNQADSTAYFFADERHGIVLDWQTHEYLHRTRGAVIASGFGANNYNITGDGSANGHAQLDLANGTFFDEDMQIDILHSSVPTSNTWQQRLQGGAYIPVFYRSNNHWKKDAATQFPLKQGTSRAQYNLNTAGTWSTVDVDNAKYGIVYIVATNNLNEPIVSILGQEQYTDQGSAEAAVWEGLSLDGFPVFEFRPLYKIVFQTATAYTNTPHAKFVGIYDLRRIVSSDVSIPNTPVSDHGSMTGLSDDDHTQYLTTARHDAHDHTTALNSATLNDLGDVTITSVATNQGLIWNGSAWVNSSIPLNLDGLSDVIISSVSANQILKYDGTNWVNAAAPSGVVGSTYFATIGNGSSNSFVLNHGLSTRDLVVTFADAVFPYTSFLTTWDATDLNNITVYFENPPASNSVRVSVYAAVSGVTANINSINDILDVDITSATPNQVLAWNGSAWINSTPSGGGSVNSYATTIGDGSNLSYTITHNLGTRDIILQARNVSSPYENYNVAWEATTINTATVYFDSAPSSNSVRIKIIA